MLSSTLRVVSHAALFLLLLALRTPASAAPSVLACCWFRCLATEARLEVEGSAPVEALTPLLTCPSDALHQCQLQQADASQSGASPTELGTTVELVCKSGKQLWALQCTLWAVHSWGGC